jgi:glycerophosphoryl diester phosphodiesterase
MGRSLSPLKKIRNAYAPYFRSLSDILKYQIVSGACLAVLLWAIGFLTDALIRSAGRVAVTSGDFTFLFTTWQGVLLILFALISLALYAASDLYTKTAYASDLINGKESPLFANIRRSFLAARKFLTPAGFLVLI